MISFCKAASVEALSFLGYLSTVKPVADLHAKI
jgi:hypothetical protein